MSGKILNQPLVSIVIVVFNSSQYILDALESIKNQSYHNLELIVSDDSSTDDTIEICANWINSNKERFTRAKCITSPVNTGVSLNANRGLRIATGDWVKLIAGDDVLEIECIKMNMDFILSNPDVKVVQSNSNYYHSIFSDSTYLRTRKICTEALNQQPYSVDFQRKVLLFSPSVNAPTLFIRRDFIESIGYFDERISSMDDWPLWIKINNCRTLIHGIDKDTVKYRVRSGSLSNDGSFINSNFKEIYKFQKEYLWGELTFLDRLFLNYELNIKNGWRVIHLSESGYIFKLIYHGFMAPVLFYRKMRLRYYRFKLTG